jgi:Eukaryotic aspartyl protease
VVVLDTGSNELWVNPDCSTALSAAQSTWCQGNPFYNPSQSSTVVDENVANTFNYGKGSVSGEYLKDTAWVSGVQVPNTIFLDASSSSDMAAGIWGTCFGAALNGQEGNIAYYGLLDLMYLDGIINSRAFSLDLMGVDTAQGTLSQRLHFNFHKNSFEDVAYSRQAQSYLAVSIPRSILVPYRKGLLFRDLIPRTARIDTGFT